MTMGGSSKFDGLMPGQASAADLGPGVEVATTPLASGDALFPSSSGPVPEGNPSAGSTNELEEPPALIHFQYKTPVGFARKDVAYQPGLRLQIYLQRLGLIGQRMRCALLVNGKRARMSYTPKPGDVVRLQPVGSAMS